MGLINSHGLRRCLCGHPRYQCQCPNKPWKISPGRRYRSDEWMDRYRVEKDWRVFYAKPVPALRLTAPRAAKRKKRRGALVLDRAFHSAAGLEEAYLAEREAEIQRKGQAVLISAMGSDDDYHGEF